MPAPIATDPGDAGVASRRLRRRLIRQLVADNLALIRGEPPSRPRPRSKRWGRLSSPARFLLAALVPASLLAPTALAPPPATVASTAQAGLPAAGAGEGMAARAGGKSVAPAAPRLAAVPTGPLDARVFPLAVERIFLDPGHGGVSHGTRTPAGLAEKELTLDLALRIRDQLSAAGFEVVLARERDLDVALAERVEMANAADADLFVSIHLNWIENRAVRGVETYYLGPTDDPYASQLAAAENRGSGYSLAELKPLLEQLYAGVRQDESRRLAEAVQRTLLASLRSVNPEVADRGVKSAPFIVLMKTEMPAILAEVSCLSNEREAELLGRPLYRQFLAEAVAAGIRAYAAGLDEPDFEGMAS